MIIKHHRKIENFKFKLDSVNPHQDFEGLWDLVDWVCDEMGWEENNSRLKDMTNDVVINELSELDDSKVYILWPNSGGV